MGETVPHRLGSHRRLLSSVLSRITGPRGRSPRERIPGGERGGSADPRDQTPRRHPRIGAEGREPIAHFLPAPSLLAEGSVTTAGKRRPRAPRPRREPRDPIATTVGSAPRFPQVGNVYIGGPPDSRRIARSAGRTIRDTRTKAPPTAKRAAPTTADSSADAGAGVPNEPNDITAPKNMSTTPIRVPPPTVPR